MTGKMNELDLLKAINEIPEEWIEHCYDKTDRKTKTKRTFFTKTAIRWVTAATTAIVLCGCGVAYATSLGIFHFDVFDDKTSHGFSLTVDTGRISADEFTGDIHEVEDFLKDYMAEETYSQTFPSWLKQFETTEQAREYIGYPDMKATKVPGDIKGVYVRVIGDTKGNLGEVSLFVYAEDGELSINETSAVFTEECPISLHGTGILHLDSFQEETGYLPDYRSEEYTTQSGRTAIFVYEDEAGGTRWLVGALTDGSVYYELSIHCRPQDSEKAKELLIQWCEQF